MDYDDILVELGEFGPWQVSITSIIVIIRSISFTAILPIIITAIKIISSSSFHR